jgi:hypothetical protein
MYSIAYACVTNAYALSYTAGKDMPADAAAVSRCGPGEAREGDQGAAVTGREQTGDAR